MKTSRVKDVGRGTTDFLATFHDLKNTNLDAFARYDGLTYWLTPGARSKQNEESYLHITVALTDDLFPSLMLEPHYRSKQGELLLNHVTVVANGKAVLDRDLVGVQHVNSNVAIMANGGYVRDPTPSQALHAAARLYSVSEFKTFSPTEAEVTGLRSISKSTEVIIKLSGTNGEVTLPARDAKAFQEEVIRGLAIYDLLERTLRRPAA
ncbi:hypothetical protein [Burkholderia stabilis]|nr:hypothetical protein [Burkholderia stabilis]